MLAHRRTLLPLLLLRFCAHFGAVCPGTHGCRVVMSGRVRGKSCETETSLPHPLPRQILITTPTRRAIHASTCTQGFQSGKNQAATCMLSSPPVALLSIRAFAVLSTPQLIHYSNTRTRTRTHTRTTAATKQTRQIEVLVDLLAATGQTDWLQSRRDRVGVRALLNHHPRCGMLLLKRRGQSRRRCRVQCD